MPQCITKAIVFKVCVCGEGQHGHLQFENGTTKIKRHCFINLSYVLGYFIIKPQLYGIRITKGYSDFPLYSPSAIWKNVRLLTDFSPVRIDMLEF